MTGGGVASVLGVAGALAVAAPALYIAYQSSSTGQSASSIAKVRSFIDIYIKPAKKPDYKLPSSQVSRFLAGIVYTIRVV